MEETTKKAEILNEAPSSGKENAEKSTAKIPLTTVMIEAPTPSPTSTEKPENKAEEVKYDSAKNATEESPKIEKMDSNATEESPKIENMDSNATEESPKIEKMDSNATEESPKIEKIYSNATEESPKIEKVDSNATEESPKIEKMDGNATEESPKIENRAENSTQAKSPDLSTSLQKTEGENQNFTKTEGENQNFTKTEGENQNFTKTELGNQTKTGEENKNLTRIERENPKNTAKAKEQEDLIQYVVGPGALEAKTDIESYTATTPIFEKKIEQETEGDVGTGYIDPSDDTKFSSSPKVFDHFCFSMVNIVIVLWLVIHMYPKVKRFFNWVQKKATKTGKNTRRMKKQMN